MVYLAVDGVLVGTCLAGKAIALVAQFHNEMRPTVVAEEHHGGKGKEGGEEISYIKISYMICKV